MERDVTVPMLMTISGPVRLGAASVLWANKKAEKTEAMVESNIVDRYRDSSVSKQLGARTC